MSEPTYLHENYKGVEIRVRCSESPRNYLWSGNYSFFTRTIARRGNDRISRDLEGTYETEQAAVDACFTAARLAVDREISSAERMVERS